ncbi:DNA replication/repair protein RecF [Deinococcus sp.]|uniref:DNA replication/repair protein RecF n=1 Tax=Deinococcus sp. TaxID=47478 RepID=UPI003CC59A88
MLLSALSTLHYRNLADARWQFPAGITGIWGANGAGKTNLLEAAYLALTGLTGAARLEVLVRRGEREAYVRADLLVGGSLSVLETGVGRGRRSIKLDGVRVRGQNLPSGSAVWIRPEDSELVYGAPALRRSFLDALLSRLSPRHAQMLSRYERGVAQRNAALRAGEDWGMGVWDEQLVTLGSEIMTLRRRAVGRVALLAAANHARLGSLRTLHLELIESTTPETFRADLGRRRGEELSRGATVLGPHRDDLRLSLDGLPAAEYASRGEARTIALALRKAELDLLQERYAEPPILLIDDFSAELDPQRRAFLLALAASVPQALVTGTDAFPGAVQTLLARAGEFVPTETMRVGGQP